MIEARNGPGICDCFIRWQTTYKINASVAPTAARVAGDSTIALKATIMSSLRYVALIKSEPSFKWVSFSSPDYATSWPKRRVEDSSVIYASLLEGPSNTASVPIVISGRGDM